MYLNQLKQKTYKPQQDWQLRHNLTPGINKGQI